MIASHRIASHRVPMTLVLVLASLSLVSVAQAQTATVKATITKPVSNMGLTVRPGASSGYQVIEFAASYEFKITGMSAGQTFGISGGDYNIKCDGAEIASSFFGISLQTADSSGEFKFSQSLGGNKTLQNQKKYTATAMGYFSTQFGSGTNTATTEFKTGPFVQPITPPQDM